MYAFLHRQQCCVTHEKAPSFSHIYYPTKHYTDEKLTSHLRQTFRVSLQQAHQTSLSVLQVDQDGLFQQPQCLDQTASASLHLLSSLRCWLQQSRQCYKQSVLYNNY